MTWNTQPAVTELNQVITHPLTSPYQDFVIEVTELVQDMVDDPDNSFGFRLRQLTEEFYRQLNFCSSDHSDSTQHPKLVITYQPSTDAEESENEVYETMESENNESETEEPEPEEPEADEILLEVYPNPSDGIVTIEVINAEGSLIEIYDINGKVIYFKDDFGTKEELDISEWRAGCYVVKMVKNYTVLTKKLIMLGR